MKKIKVLLYLATFVVLNQLSAQEQLGIYTDNYAGINAVQLNPAAHLSSPFQWDVNLIGAHFFVDNNYAYLRNTRIPFLLRNRDDIEFVHAPDIDAERPIMQNEVVLDYFRDGRERFVQSNTRILGPSFYVKLGENHSIGAFTRARAELSSKGISNDFSYYDYFDRPFFDDFPVTSFQASFMTWSEVGINYMYQQATNNGKIGIGVSAKFIQPYEAAFFSSNSSADFAKLPGDSLTANRINLEYGYTTSNLTEDNFERSNNGGGVAFDLGFVYTIGYEDQYEWKFGASILDLGRANFNQNASFHQVVIDSSVIVGSDSYNSFDEIMDLESVVQSFSQEILGDSTASLAGNEFGLWLPTAFSLQIDRAFTENIYLNATLVQNMPIGKTGVQRSNILALTPRFEHRWFGASLPVVLHNWQDFRLGLSLKLGFLYLGTDNLGSFTSNNDLTGTDFYAALKINPFNLGLGKNGGGKNRRRNRGQVKCYDF